MAEEPINFSVLTRASQSDAVHRMIIRTENGSNVFTTRYPPLEVSYGGFEAQYEEIGRPGRKPLLRRSGLGLKTIDMTFRVFRNRLASTSVDDLLKKLQQLANAKQPLQIEYEPRTSGLWVITSLSYESEMREFETNHIARATVDVEFTQYVTKIMRQRPPVGSSPGAGSGGGSGNGGKRVTYTVRKGDTLYSIAKKFYGDANRWKVIAKANNIKDPRKLKVGKVIKIPSIELVRVE